MLKILEQGFQLKHNLHKFAVTEFFLKNYIYEHSLSDVHFFRGRGGGYTIKSLTKQTQL